MYCLALMLQSIHLLVTKVETIMGNGFVLWWCEGFSCSFNHSNQFSVNVLSKCCFKAFQTAGKQVSWGKSSSFFILLLYYTSICSADECWPKYNRCVEYRYVYWKFVSNACSDSYSLIIFFLFFNSGNVSNLRPFYLAKCFIYHALRSFIYFVPKS